MCSWGLLQTSLDLISSLGGGSDLANSGSKGLGLSRPPSTCKGANVTDFFFKLRGDCFGLSGSCLLLQLAMLTKLSVATPPPSLLCSSLQRSVLRGKGKIFRLALMMRSWELS